MKWFQKAADQGNANAEKALKALTQNSIPSEMSPNTLAKPSLPAIAFGKEKWATYIGDVGVEPSLPSNIHGILKSPCPFWPGKKVQEIHLLTLIPKTVNGKPLTLNSLKELVKGPKQGHATKYGHYWDAIEIEHGSAAPTSSYWILFTKDVIPQSRNKTYDYQKQLLFKYVAYEVPELLEAAVSIFMDYVQTGAQLYSDRTWTRCQEKVSFQPDWRLVIGGFEPSGLQLYIYIGDFVNYGVGGVRKF